MYDLARMAERSPRLGSSLDGVKLDRHYLKNWSIGTDLTIIARPVLVGFAKKGAYEPRSRRTRSGTRPR